MKKTLVVVLALVLAFSLITVASAETRSYMMAAVTDADGNLLACISDDLNTVVDANGNDITADWPILVFVCDDEAMTGTFGTETEAAACTLTEEATEDGTTVFTATFEDNSTMMLIYDAETDMFGYTDAETGYIYAMMDITDLA